MPRAVPDDFKDFSVNSWARLDPEIAVSRLANEAVGLRASVFFSPVV
jgi:hypothetical protein